MTEERGGGDAPPKSRTELEPTTRVVANKSIDMVFERELDQAAEDFVKNSAEPIDERLERAIFNRQLLTTTKASYQKWMAIKEDPEVLDVVFAAGLDRKVSGDPLWLFVVGASGSDKTETLRTMEEIDGFYKLSNLTSRTIISGKQRKDETIVRGLYKKIDGKVLLITELSQILTKDKDERQAIFSQLRDLYDGYAVSGYGIEDEPIKAKCLMGLICGVTSIIDAFGSVQAALGERFLKIRPKYDRTSSRKQAMKNQLRLVEMRQELATAAKNLFTTIQIYEPELTDIQTEQIGMYAEFTAFVRTTVTSQSFRDYNTAEWQPEPEFATRLSQQLQKLARSLAILRGHVKVTDEDLETVRRVAEDCCIPARIDIIKNLARLTNPKEHRCISEISAQTGIEWSKCCNVLEALVVLKIVDETNQEAKHNERWYCLSEQFRLLMQQAKITEGQTKLG